MSPKNTGSFTPSTASTMEGDDLTFDFVAPDASGSPRTFDWIIETEGDVGDDAFSAMQGQVTLPAGETRTTITVSTGGDELNEPNREFTLNIVDSDGDKVARNHGTIIDNDM